MPLDILDDTPLHVSVSQLKTWMRCPRAYELKYVRGAEPEVVPHALVFGSAFHTALATSYGRKRDRAERATLDELVAVFADAWREHEVGGVAIEKADGDPVDAGRRMLATFVEHDALDTTEVIAIERPITAVLHDPETGEVLEEVLTGVVDLIVKDDGLTVVVEHKTSARRYADDQLQYDHQVTAYQLALRQEGVADVGLRFQVFTKGKTPAVQVEDVIVLPQFGMLPV